MNDIRMNGAGRAVRFLGTVGIVGSVLVALLLWGVPVYGRYQVRANAANEIQVNELRIQQTEKEAQVKVQEAEILRREKELIATVLKPAEVERQRIETLASAEKARLTTEAEGRGSSIRVQGEAEASIIFQKGEAEAKAMNLKAEAYQGWNQAAVVDKLLTNMADVVRAMSEPLSKVDRITVVSTGNDGAAGVNKITGDMTKIAAQVPAIFEALSGMDIKSLMANVQTMRQKPNGAVVEKSEPSED